MIALFIFGLLAIAVLIGVMKRVELDVPFISAITIFSLALLLMIEAMLAWMLLGGKKVEKRSDVHNELNKQAVKGIYAPRHNDFQSQHSNLFPVLQNNYAHPCPCSQKQ